MSTVSWSTDYLTVRPQFVSFDHVLSDVVVSDKRVPQSTVLSPFLFTLYIKKLFLKHRFMPPSEVFLNDSEVVERVSCVSSGQEAEYKG